MSHADHLRNLDTYGDGHEDASPAAVLDDLKAQWLHDPCWDIEETQGFEAFRDELLAFRLEQEHQWQVERAAQERQCARDWGIFGHVCSSESRFGSNMKALLEHIDSLERRILQLENPGEAIL